MLFTTFILSTLTSTEGCVKLLPSVKWFKYFRKNNLSRVSGQTLIYFHVTVLHSIIVIIIRPELFGYATAHCTSEGKRREDFLGEWFDLGKRAGFWLL